MKLSPTMQAQGYTATKTGNIVRVFQHGEYVASLSPMLCSFDNRWGFDWHRADQWHLRARDLEELT